MKVTALGNNVVIKPVTSGVAEDLAKLDIVLPESKELKTKNGEIVSIGPEVKKEMGLEVGQLVMHRSYGHEEIEGQKLIVIPAEQLLVRFEKE